MKKWVLVASLLCWQLGPVVSAAPHAAAVAVSEAVPCHGMTMAADTQPSHDASHQPSATNGDASNLPPCCVKHNCQGDCMHSPASAMPVLLIVQAVQDHPPLPAPRETMVEVRIAEFFRPPI